MTPEIIQTKKHKFLVTKDRTYGPAPRVYYTAWLPTYPFCIVNRETLEPDPNGHELISNMDQLPAMWIDDAFSLEELKAKLEDKFGKYCETVPMKQAGYPS